MVDILIRVNIRKLSRTVEELRRTVWVALDPFGASLRPFTHS